METHGRRPTESGGPNSARHSRADDRHEISVDAKLEPPERNAGIQFRSKRINDAGQAYGFQADIGGQKPGSSLWGKLYHEHGKGDWDNKAVGIVNEREWNDHRIRCEGKRIRIWINGVQTVDYTEQDPDIPQTGIIALQVHGKKVMEARYRSIRIKEL